MFQSEFFTAEYALGVEEKGLSVTWSALRVSYAMGGDGETNIRADLRHLAAFVRDPCTVVSCILLPLSCSMHLDMKVSAPPPSQSDVDGIWIVMHPSAAQLQFAFRHEGDPLLSEFDAGPSYILPQLSCSLHLDIEVGPLCVTHLTLDSRTPFRRSVAAFIST
jgi:hypothetical protein